MISQRLVLIVNVFEQVGGSEQGICASEPEMRQRLARGLTGASRHAPSLVDAVGPFNTLSNISRMVSGSRPSRPAPRTGDYGVPWMNDTDTAVLSLFFYDLCRGKIRRDMPALSQAQVAWVNQCKPVFPREVRRQLRFHEPLDIWKALHAALQQVVERNPNASVVESTRRFAAEILREKPEMGAFPFGQRNTPRVEMPWVEF